jgi:flagellin
VRINTNVSSLQAQRAVSEHTKQIESSSGKLSSGLRVRSAADDSASLSIGLKSKAEVRSQYQAIRNANDVISELQVAEGGMNEVGSMLIRLKELSVQAANGTLQDEDRGMLNSEYMQLRSEIERQIQTTKLNGDTLLRPGPTPVREFQIGTKANAESRLTISQRDLTIDDFNMNIIDSNVSSIEDARLNIEYVNSAIQKVAENRARVGAYQNRVQSTISNLGTSSTNESASLSQRMDADYALETAENVRAQQKLNAATAVLAQTNNMGSSALKLIG